MIRVPIKHVLSDETLFECDVPACIPATRLKQYAATQAVRDGVSLRGACLAGDRLSGADLRGADLRGADLRGADLSNADLREAELNGACLAHANLSNADLREAELNGASLAYANPRGAIFGGADLRGADLNGADLNGATFGTRVTANRGLLQLTGLEWQVLIFDEHMQIGCEMHSLDDWAAFDDKRILKMDGRRALRFWRRHKATLLALASRGEAQP